MFVKSVLFTKCGNVVARIKARLFILPNLFSALSFGFFFKIIDQKKIKLKSANCGNVAGNRHFLNLKSFQIDAN